MSDDEFTTGALAMMERLLQRAHLTGAAELADIVTDTARTVGADGVVLYLVDQEQTMLVPVPTPGVPEREALGIQGTLAGRAYTSASVVRTEGGAGRGRRLWFPLLDGTDRVGVMEVSFPGPHAPREALVAALERFAHLVAILVISKSAYSDYFELLRRRKEMTAAAELLAALTPPRVLATRDFVLGALLEPAYDMGGDAFDYAHNGDTLHVAVFDAMGHGLAAAGVAAFTLAVYRNSRRRRLALAECYAAVDAAIAEQYPDTRFVTAVMAELEISSGELTWLSAGHPPPLLVRGGRRVTTLDVTPAPPAGVGLALEPPLIARYSLEPGDMVLLYTDGLTEARRPDGELFTAERLGEFIEREAAGGHAAPETLRRLREAIIGRGAGSLRDDATALLVEWRRGSERELVPDTV